jgi:hypothetical protein
MDPDSLQNVINKTADTRGRKKEKSNRKEENAKIICPCS